MKPRFNFFENPDSEFLKHANRIKLDLLVGEDGNTWMSYEIHGGVSAGDDDNEGEPGKEQPDAAQLADNLLRRFVQAKGGTQ